MALVTVAEFIDRFTKEESEEVQRAVCIRHALRILPFIYRAKDEPSTLRAFRVSLYMLNAVHDPTLINEQARRGFTRYWDEPSGVANVQETVTGAFRTVVPKEHDRIARNAELCIADGFDAISDAFRLKGDIEDFDRKLSLSRIRSRVVDVLNADLGEAHRRRPPDLLALPLWPKSVPFAPQPFEGIGIFDDATNQFLGSADEDPQTWLFWANWYRGILDGASQNWELQRQIALIPSEDWQRGAEHIALIIKEIEARLEVRARAEDVRALLADALAPRHGIGHNNPPEPMDDEPLTSAEQLETQALIARVLHEVSLPVPDKAVVSRAMTQIRVVAGKIAAWCAKKADMAIDEFLKKVSATLGVGLTGFALGQLPNLVSGLSALAEAISRWLPLLH